MQELEENFFFYLSIIQSSGTRTKLAKINRAWCRSSLSSTRPVPWTDLGSTLNQLVQLLRPQPLRVHFTSMVFIPVHSNKSTELVKLLRQRSISISVITLPLRQWNQRAQALSKFDRFFLSMHSLIEAEIPPTRGAILESSNMDVNQEVHVYTGKDSIFIHLSYPCYTIVETDWGSFQNLTLRFQPAFSS